MATKYKRVMNMQKEVRDLMKEHNLSREDVASKMGISSRTIYRWECGESRPKSRLMVREFGKLKQGLGKREAHKNIGG